MTFGAIRGFLRFLLLALVGLLVSCQHRPPLPALTLEVEYKGCWAFYLPNQVCALDPNRRLNLWVRVTSPGMKVEMRAGGQIVAKTGGDLSSGKLYQLLIPKHSDLLTVATLPSDGSAGPDWSLRLAEPEKPLWMSNIQTMSPPEERTLLEHLREAAPRQEQSFVLQSLAFFARRDGNSKEQEKLLLKSLSLDRADNRWSGEVRNAVGLAELYTEQGRFSEAEEILEKLPSPSKAPADSKQFLAYSHGLLADGVDDYRLALKQLRKASELAGRIGMKPSFRWDTEQVLARILQDLGRSPEAWRMFKSLIADPNPSNPCDLGTLLTNMGWSLISEREAGGDAGDPIPLLQQAKAKFEVEKHGCTRSERLNARINLALAYQQEARWPEARRELEEARALQTEPTLSQRLWWDDLEARGALAAGQPEKALGLYKQLEKRAEVARSPEGRLRALLGQANAWHALGQTKLAIDALAEADLELDKQSWHIPVHEGRDTFLAHQEMATRFYLELLLDEGLKEQAFELARRARSRLLRQLAVRDRLAQLNPEEQRKWARLLSSYRSLRDAFDDQASKNWQWAKSEKKHAQEVQEQQLAAARDALDGMLASLGAPEEGRLSPPGPGEVILAYFPLRADKWAGFADTTVRDVEVSTFKLPPGTPTDEELSQALLKPFQAALEASEQVRVLSYGRLRSVSFHALPFDGAGPLLAKHLVVYSLDLPVHAPPALASGQPLALLVSDPLGDLPAARKEARLVANAIRAKNPNWKLQLLPGEEASFEAVRKELPNARLFHYAGHGVFAGFAGWDSELPLAGDSRLTLGDVLALHAAPPWVVLSSCDTALSSAEAPGEGIGLANAFLLAGSQQVVAATSLVTDLSSKDLMSELYGGWQAGADLSHQLRRAQLACRRKDPSTRADWASFRLLVP
jgi:hypothetical protein